MCNTLGVTDMDIEKLIAQQTLYQRTILVEIYIPLKLNKMYNAYGHVARFCRNIFSYDRWPTKKFYQP